MDDRREVVERALRYPYGTPAASFALAGERMVGLGDVAVDLAKRIPLLAYGSNASPEVLLGKLGGGPDPVPVVRATLSDFDVVYSAHISAYGSVPATIQPSPGTEAPVFVAYLTAEQHELIDRTEPNYERSRLTSLTCRLESGESVDEASVYLSRHGSLLLAGAEVALRAVRSHGRRFPEMDQRQVLEHVRDLLAPGRGLERFILDWVSGETRLGSVSLNRAEPPQRESGENPVGPDQGGEVQ